MRCRQYRYRRRRLTCLYARLDLLQHAFLLLRRRRVRHKRYSALIMLGQKSFIEAQFLFETRWIVVLNETIGCIEHRLPRTIILH